MKLLACGKLFLELLGAIVEVMVPEWSGDVTEVKAKGGLVLPPPTADISC